MCRQACASARQSGAVCACTCASPARTRFRSCRSARTTNPETHAHACQGKERAREPTEGTFAEGLADVIVLLDARRKEREHSHLACRSQQRTRCVRGSEGAPRRAGGRGRASAHRHGSARDRRNRGEAAASRAPGAIRRWGWRVRPWSVRAAGPAGAGRRNGAPTLPAQGNAGRGRSGRAGTFRHRRGGRHPARRGAGRGTCPPSALLRLLPCRPTVSLETAAVTPKKKHSDANTGRGVQTHA